MRNEERRRADRVPFVADVVYTVGEFSCRRRSIDISPEGLFIDEKLPPEDGEVITVEFTLKGRYITARGQVVGRQPPIGFGVLIEEIDAEDLRRIVEYVQESK